LKKYRQSPATLVAAQDQLGGEDALGGGLVVDGAVGDGLELDGVLPVKDHLFDGVRKDVGGGAVEDDVAHGDLSGQGLPPALGADDAAEPIEVLLGVVLRGGGAHLHGAVPSGEVHLGSQQVGHAPQGHVCTPSPHQRTGAEAEGEAVRQDVGPAHGHVQVEERGLSGGSAAGGVPGGLPASQGVQQGDQGGVGDALPGKGRAGEGLPVYSHRQVLRPGAGGGERRSRKQAEEEYPSFHTKSTPFRSVFGAFAPSRYSIQEGGPGGKL